jgi:ribosomal-protein-alanine N-acetyltransferase
VSSKVNVAPGGVVPTLALEGARLRALRPDDAAALCAYLSDPAVTERTSYPDVTLPLAEAMVERARSRWAAGELGKWGLALSESDALVGTCGFNEWSPTHRWAELGFDLARAQWGRGLMRAAASAVLDWAFDEGHIDRAQAFVRVDNARSTRLLEALGFAREGRLRSFRVCRGQAHDFYVYGLLRAEWRAGA